jgi:hypothetical protein
MLDQEEINNYKAIICDRFTADELIDYLGIDTDKVFEAFLDECLEACIYQDLLDE